MSLDRIHRTWERLAEEDPLWAIVSRPEMKGNKWDEEAFFRTGRETVDALLEGLRERGHGPPPGKALDFGCGAGRLTQALGQHFDQVHGVDVSSRMVELAWERNRLGDRCRYHASPSQRLPFDDGTFSFVLSLVTLQHIPPRLSEGYVAELLRVLAPGGMACFQMAAEPVIPEGKAGGARGLIRRVLPAPLLARVRSLRAGLRSRSSGGYELHGVPRSRVERIVARSGGRMAEAREDRMAGADWTSFTYLAIRS